MTIEMTKNSEIQRNEVETIGIQKQKGEEYTIIYSSVMN